MTKTSGFTLLELMIVVAIVGLLAMVAIPSYLNNVLKGHRADGQGILLDLAAKQERFITQNNTYTTDISSATGLNLGTTVSREGYYNLSATACGGGSIAACYIIVATATGGQTKDTDCLTITYSSAGIKGGTTGDCW